MKTQTTIASQWQTIDNLEKYMMKAVRMPLTAVSDYYGKILDRQINIKQTWCLLHAQLAFFATVFVGSSIIVTLLCVVWLVSALLRCKREL